MAQGLIRPRSGPNRLPTLPTPTPATCSRICPNGDACPGRVLHARAEHLTLLPRVLAPLRRCGEPSAFPFTRSGPPFLFPSPAAAACGRDRRRHGRSCHLHGRRRSCVSNLPPPKLTAPPPPSPRTATPAPSPEAARHRRALTTVRLGLGRQRTWLGLHAPPRAKPRPPASARGPARAPPPLPPPPTSLLRPANGELLCSPSKITSGTLS